MAGYELKTDGGLKQAAEALQRGHEDQQWYREWIDGLVADFEWIRRSGRGERSTFEFQQRLWEDNHVSSVGQGNVSVDRALKDEGFRTWLADRSLEPLGDSPEKRIEFLTGFYEELMKRLEPLCDRAPRLKAFRVLAALFPGELTAICYRRALRRLCFAMGGSRGTAPVARHAFVLTRLTEALGKPGPDLRDVARRVALPWLLYAGAVDRDQKEATEEPTSTPGEEKLIPLPASRRRRGACPKSAGRRFMKLES